MLRRNLVHSALLLVLSWAGLAAFYLWSGAEFVAFAQVLVYVGAVSMVVLFAVLLTRQNPDRAAPPDAAARLRAGAAVLTAAAVGAVIGHAILATPLPAAAGAPPVLTVRQLGLELMGRHAGSLLVIGALLTVALLGAVVLAAAEPGEKPGGKP
ncbi:MAG: NADH-quinone oxidoreductase subunit J [Opitutaceae bacterium]|nr:NADH-quinone oxidoreductase subunit J [Opitutaceae bacterium]